jgi:hypothetical protein
MALRKPLVLNGGQIQQLQAADTLDAPQSGGDVLIMTNDEAGALIPGNVVYNDAVDGVKKAKADAAGTSKVIGISVDAPAAAAAGRVMVSGILALTTAQWDAAFGTTGGLVFGTIYYLSPTTSGLGTVTGPSTVGQSVVELGIAISTTELMVRIRQAILL